MLSLDLFNTVYERALNEGAVDDLEARRIHGLSTKMLDLMTRAKDAKPEMKAALMREYAKIKDERDSYFKIRNEMGYGGLTHEDKESHMFKGPHGRQDVEHKDGVTRVQRRDSDWDTDHRDNKKLGIKYFPNGKLKGQGSGSAVKSGSSVSSGQGSMRKMPRLDHDGNDMPNYDVNEAGIGQDIVNKTEKMARATPPTKAGAVASTVKNAAKWLAGKGGPGKEGPTYEAAQKKNSEQVDEDNPRDLAAALMLKKAHAAFPIAKNDAEALALWIADKEQRDVNRLERENDKEDEMIARIADQLKKQNTPVIDEHGGGIGPKQRWQDLMPEGYQDFNKVEPYEVCLAGRPVKTFDYYEDARRFHDNWKKKLYNQGEQAKADKITLNPVMKEAQLDELSPETLKSYLKKSKGHSQKYDQLGNKADDKGDEALANKMWNKGDNRYAGAEQARVKLADLKDKKKGVAEDWIDDDAAEPLAKYFADLYYGDFSATYKVKLTSHIYQAIQNGELSIEQLKADIDMLEKEKGIKEMDKSQPGAAGWNIDDYPLGAKGTTAKPTTVKNVVKTAAKDLDAAFNSPEQLKKDADYRAYRKGVKQSRKEQPKPIKEFAPTPVPGDNDDLSTEAQKDGFRIGASSVDGMPLEQAFGYTQWDEKYKLAFSSGWVKGRQFKIKHAKNDGVDLVLQKNGSLVRAQGVKENQTKFVRTHKPNCGWNFGHDCDCGGTLTHAKNCGHRFGHDCDCGLDKAKQQGVTEAETDYSKRRQREKDIDAGKPVPKQRQPRMTDYQKKRAQDKKNMELGESNETRDAVESAIIRRIMVAHTDLLMKFGPQKVMDAASAIADEHSDVEEIGTSDVSAYVQQVERYLAMNY